MASIRNSWHVPLPTNSSVKMIKANIRDAILACATNGKTDSILLGTISNEKFAVLGETTNAIVGLDYCELLHGLFYVDETGSVWRHDLREGGSAECLSTDVCGLKSMGNATAASLTIGAYHFAVASQFSGNLLKKCKKRNVRKELKESDNDSEDSENSPHTIHLLDLRKMNDIVKNYSDFHSDTIQALKFDASNPNLLMSGGADGLLNFINCDIKNKHDELEATQSMLSSVDCVGFLTGNRAYGTTDDGRYAIFKLNSAEDIDMICRREFATDERFLVNILDITDPDSFLLIGSSRQGETLVNCVSNNGKKMKFVDSFNDHSDLIRCCAYDTLQNLLITGGDDGQIVCRQLSECLSKSSYSAGHVEKRSKIAKKRKPY